MITENLSTLKIHKLSQVQYNRELADGNVDETALYLTPDKQADHVIAEGTSDVWYYRKWASGRAECWRYYDGLLENEETSNYFHAYINTPFPFPSDSMYVDDGTYTYTYTANWCGDLASGGDCMGIEFVDENTVQVAFYKATAGTTHGVGGYLHITGFWK